MTDNKNDKNNTNNIKGILFDFNGTLFFDSHFHLKAFRELYRERGLEIPTDEYIVRHIFGRSNDRIYRENFNPNPTPQELAEFSEIKEERYRRFCRENRDMSHITDGAEEMLDYLKANSIPYCLATGSEIDNINFYMEELGLGRWFSFDNIVYFDGSFKGKPEPDTYLLAAKKLGLAPNECMVFEDGTSGIISAQRAGAGAVVAVFDHNYPSPLQDGVTCDGVYPDFKNWKEILKKFGILK